MIIRSNQKYRDISGVCYSVLTLAQHCKTGEKLVIYQAEEPGGKVYAAPLDVFVSEMDTIEEPTAEADRHTIVDIPKSAAAEADRRAIVDMPKSAVSEANPVETSKTTETSEIPADSQTVALDPLLEAFLDADTYRERLNILHGIHHRITDDMINTMAVVMDVEVPEGDIEDRYGALQQCLITLEKYECTRLN